MALDLLASLLGGFSVFLWIFMVFMLVMIGIVWVYAALVLMALAKKTDTPHRWMAWIPILNIYLMTQIAGVSGWWTLLFLAGFIPFIGSLAVLVFAVYLWWKTAERVGRPGWWGILMIIPVVNFVVMGMLAWGKSKAPAMKRTKIVRKKKK